MVSKSIVVFADTVEAYEELCSGARALDCRPVALFAGSADDAERVSMWGARVVHVGEVPEGALYIRADHSLRKACAYYGARI